MCTGPIIESPDLASQSLGTQKSPISNRAIWIPAKLELKDVSPPPPQTESVLQGTSQTEQRGLYLSRNASITRPIILHSRKQKEQAKKHGDLSVSRNVRMQPRSSEFNHTFPYETRRLIYDYLLGDELIRLERPSHEPTLRLWMEP